MKAKRQHHHFMVTSILTIIILTYGCDNNNQVSQSLNKSDDCSASVSYDSHKIFNDEKIDVVFEIAVSDCKFSSGTFDFDVITKDLETDENKTEERGGFWPARDTNPTTITTEKFSLKSGEKFITISRPSEVKCACIDR